MWAFDISYKSVTVFAAVVFIVETPRDLINLTRLYRWQQTTTGKDRLNQSFFLNNELNTQESIATNEPVILGKDLLPENLYLN